MVDMAFNAPDCICVCANNSISAVSGILKIFPSLIIDRLILLRLDWFMVIYLILRLLKCWFKFFWYGNPITKSGCNDIICSIFGFKYPPTLFTVSSIISGTLQKSVTPTNLLYSSNSTINSVILGANDITLVTVSVFDVSFCV